MKKSLRTIAIIVFIGTLIIGVNGCKKDRGCTDSTAFNYDSDADRDDGSCRYYGCTDATADNYDSKATDSDGSCINGSDAYTSADGINGGKLYSKFYASETSWSAPSGITAADISGYGNFYRCKQCHGWDLEGKVGAYIDRGPNTGRPSVAGSIRSHIIASTAKGLFNDIKNTGGRAVNTALTQDGTNGQGNAMPDFGTMLTDAQIWDIVKFLREEAYDVSLLYDIATTGTYPTGSRTFSNVGKDGNAASGDTYFASNCSSCHGADGTLIALEGKSVGQFIRSKPYETQHKVKFGHLGSTMTGFPGATISNVKDLFVAGTDTTNFPDL